MLAESPQIQQPEEHRQAPCAMRKCLAAIVAAITIVQ
jgi:hypothetical protein